MVVEYIDNLGAWKTLVSFGAAAIDDGSDFASDIQRPMIAKQWRIRDASGNNIVPNIARFRKVHDEINMAQLNRDDYVNLPNKYGNYSGPESLLAFTVLV